MNEALAVLWKLAAVGAVLYVMLGVWAHYVSLRMLFPRPPARYERTAEHFFLTTPDGVKINARFRANPSAKHTILFCHGNGEDLGSVSTYLEDYHKQGYSILSWEYRGYGHSGGEPDEPSTYADAEMMLNWLKQRGVPLRSVVLYGYSLGGGPATELARRHEVGGLVLEAAFVSAYRVMTRWPLVYGDKFKNLAKLEEVKCPVLVLHGTADEMIPLWHGERLFAAAREPKMKLFISGATHGGVVDTAKDKYWTTLRCFAESLSKP
jgi:alpha-beta hydrolase superfamily lysophospholipase